MHSIWVQLPAPMSSSLQLLRTNRVLRFEHDFYGYCALQETHNNRSTFRRPQVLGGRGSRHHHTWGYNWTRNTINQSIRVGNWKKSLRVYVLCSFVIQNKDQNEQRQLNICWYGIVKASGCPAAIMLWSYLLPPTVLVCSLALCYAVWTVVFVLFPFYLGVLIAKLQFEEPNEATTKEELGRKRE